MTVVASVKRHGRIVIHKTLKCLAHEHGMHGVAFARQFRQLFLVSSMCCTQ